MKKQDLKKLHKQSPQELDNQVLALQQQLVTTKQEVKLSKQKNTSGLKKIRYQIAVIKTIQTEHRLRQPSKPKST